MKTIFKLFILSVVVVGVVGALVYPEKLKLYAGTGKRIIQEKIEEAQGLETKLALLETKVSGLKREIEKLKTDVIRRQVDVEYLEGIIAEKEEASGRLRETLERASRLLADGKEAYLIGGREYSHGEVSRDAAEKLKIFRIQGETLENLAETLRTKKGTLEMARENVTNAENVKVELTAKVMFLKAELEKYKAKEIFAETVNAVDLAHEFKTEIGKTQKMLADFEKQLDMKDRILEERIRINGDYVGGIDYSKPGVSSDRDVVADIEACFEEIEKGNL